MGSPDTTPTGPKHNHPTPTFDRRPEGECGRCDELRNMENAIVRFTPKEARRGFGA